MVGQIATAIGITGKCGLHGARMLPQLRGRLPGGGGASSLVLLGPVIEFGRGRGGPVAPDELSEGRWVHGQL